MCNDGKLGRVKSIPSIKNHATLLSIAELFLIFNLFLLFAAAFNVWKRAEPPRSSQNVTPRDTDEHLEQQCCHNTQHPSTTSQQITRDADMYLRIRDHREVLRVFASRASRGFDSERLANQ